MVERMSDLVSRQEVNKVVDELEVYTVGRLNTQKVEISVLQLQRFINALKEIPTAYNVDKVMEELKDYAEGDPCDRFIGCPYYDGSDISCEQCSALGAIDIVKRGGVK